MSMDPNRWLKTLPTNKTLIDDGNNKLNDEKWINTIPSKKTINPIKRYSFTAALFIVGLIFVSVIKNETRSLQKEINNLLASVNALKFDLHKATLDHEVITSPENISQLAKKYLESNFDYYKKNQIKKLREEEINLTKLQKENSSNMLNKKNTNLSKEIKLKVTKKIEQKKTELKKLQEMYSEPEKLPEEIKITVAKRIENTKSDLKKLYSDPKGSIMSAKTQKWVVMQVVKVFLGIPIIPGK